MPESSDRAASGRARRAHAILLTWQGASLSGIHYPTRRTATVDAVDAAVLAAAGDWVDAEGLASRVVPHVGMPAYRRALDKLFAAHHLLHEGSDAERLDAAVRDRWPWGHATAFYQLSIRDPGYVTAEQAAARLRQCYESRPPLALTGRPLTGAPVADEPIALPVPDPTDPLFAMFERRRSRRTFAAEPLALSDLARVLAAGLGITAWAKTGYSGRDISRLPLKAAPSGGARNPYEGYVLAGRVDLLSAGVYHYDGVAHRLRRLPGEGVPPSRLLGGQRWFDEAAAVVFLVAHFDRTAWKYDHPTAYRVVLMEAGHIAQNLLLAAADRDLAATPTAAIHDREAERVLGIEAPLRSAVYAVALGHRGPGRSIADFREIEPNPVFQQKE